MVIEKTNDCFIMVKNLVDGSKAVGLFNRGMNQAEVTVDWSELQLNDKQLIRDLWRQKNLGIFNEKFSAQVPSQGVVMVRVGKP